MKKKHRWMKTRAEREADKPKKQAQIGRPDYILGSINAVPNVHGRVQGPAVLVDPWQNCRLARILIHPQTVWNSPVPDYAKGERPQHLIPGLAESDKQMLFGALPHVSTALKYDPNATPEIREQAVQEEMDKQDKQTEMMYRVLDLRNASRKEINKLNRRRIIEEFGGGKGVGCSFVQGESSSLPSITYHH
jgi:small subunit ribosomal protein S15